VTQVITDMGNIRMDDGFVTRRLFTSLIRHTGVICMLSYQGQAYALNDWTYRPSVTASEIYSDNINLAPSGNEKSAFVTELSPGVSIIRQTARTTLNLNYRMQNLYNSGGNGGLKTANQLQYNSHNIFVPNRLFLDSRSSVSQQNINSNQIANDNISGSGNSTNVATFGLSPYWTPHFSNVANGNFRVNFDTLTTGVNSSSNTTSGAASNPISDSTTLGEVIQLNSGTKFKRINWGLSLNNTENYRSNGNDVKFQNSNAIVRTYLNRYFNVFAQGGHSNNSFQSTTNTNKNGVFYTVGGQWKPSQHYSVEAGAGNNSFVTINISPIQRVNWRTTYRDNKIGLNSGKTWQTALNYRTRQSVWTLTHDNDTTTTQEILSQLQIFQVQDQFGNPIINPVTNQPYQAQINIPTLTDEVIVRKRWGFSSSYNTGKSTISANAYNEDRVFQVSGRNQKVRGINATWNWQFASRTSAYLRPGWQHTDGSGPSVAVVNSNADNSNSDRYDIAIGLNRSITSRLNGRLELRHVNQASDSNAIVNGIGLSDLNTNSYQENRATASLFMRF